MVNNRIVVFNRFADHIDYDSDDELGFFMFEELLENHHKLTFLYNVLETSDLLESVTDIEALFPLDSVTDSIDVVITFDEPNDMIIDRFYAACRYADKHHICECTSINQIDDSDVKYYVHIIDI